MATSNEFETVERIQKAIAKARNAKKDVPIALSLDKEYYRKAISSIYSCGLFTMIAGFFSIASASIANVYSFSQEGYPSVGYVIGVFLGILLVCMIPITLGYKIKSLDTTPRFMLGLLIASLVVNLVLSAGILPLIALVFNISALIRWSTYKDWFYTIAKRK